MASRPTESFYPRFPPNSTQARETSGSRSEAFFLKKDLTDVVQTFAPSVDAMEKVQISEVVPLASYSWLPSTKSLPTILVPGSPPTYTAADPTRVPADSGLSYIDQNSARVGDRVSPLAPLVAAVEHMGNQDKLPGFDVLADRNTLRKLLRWAANPSETKDFRIEIELSGKTCLFTRTEENDSETIQGFRGFGSQYMKAATKPAKGNELATGHHRIISLELGGIKVLLRFVADACLADGSETVQTVDPMDELASAMQALKTDTGPSKTKAGATLRFGVVVQGDRTQALVPQSSLIEMKTRAAHRPLDWEEAYPQMYLSQTAHLYLARHTKGVFEPPEKYELGAHALRSQARAAQADMGKLKVALEAIVKAVRKQGEGQPLSLVCESGTLKLYRRKLGTGRPVGNDILGLFKFAA